MAEVLLFIHDFKLGTAISDTLTRMDITVEFVENPTDWLGLLGAETRLVVIDLDDEKYLSHAIISLLKVRNPEIRIVGYLAHVMKETRDRMKSAGCDLIISRSSLLKNIPSLVRNL
ncbi:MAG: hypothetical protein ABIA75_03925 [Candidatus Neomarinimicrobiota bacterium]